MCRRARLLDGVHTATAGVDGVVVVDYMKAVGVKTVGYIGYNDGWGDLVYGGLEKSADPMTSKSSPTSVMLAPILPSPPKHCTSSRPRRTQ